ncbi:group II intron reverse transcriptase/maturase [Micromonospora marina]|uniref:group II intron reverse transcriptase/maturase n=1 Tax=Micromonospora marina TaxID=307120 RepID=UPI0035E9D510
MPLDVVKGKCAPYLHRGQPAKQTALQNGSDYTIVATFGAIYRGIVQYYLLAGDVFRLHRLRWVMETSMLKTLAGCRGTAWSAELGTADLAEVRTVCPSSAGD